MSKQLKINSQLTSRQQNLDSSHKQDFKINQQDHSHINQLAISRMNTVHGHKINLGKYSQIANSENQLLRQQRTTNNSLLQRDSVQNKFKQAQVFQSECGGLNNLHHGTYIQPSSMQNLGVNDQSHFQKQWKPQQFLHINELKDVNFQERGYNSKFHQHDPQIIGNNYQMEPLSPGSTTQDTAQSMAGSWSPQPFPDQLEQQNLINQECSSSVNNYLVDGFTQNDFSLRLMDLDLEDNSFDNFVNSQLNKTSIDQAPDFIKSATNRPSYFSNQRAHVAVPQDQHVMGQQRFTFVENPWSQYQQYNGFYGSDLEVFNQLWCDDLSQRFPQYLNQNCVKQTLSTDEDTSVSMQGDLRGETVEARDTSTASSQSTQLVEASKNQKVSKSNCVSTSDHFSSVDVPPSNEPQDRRHIEPQLKEVKTKKDYGYKFILRNFRQSFAEDFLKHLIQVYEEFYHSESISAEEHMEKVWKKFYKEPIQDIVQYVASFLKVFHFIEEPSDYELFQAIAFILPTRYGQSQVPKKADSSKAKDIKKPKKPRTIEELALDQIKFEKKQKKLRGNLTELFDMLPEAWLPSQNFSGNDYFDKATKDLRNRFFKLDFVGLVWNRTMANATEKIIKFRGNTHAQHEQTFRKITSEFLMKRSEFILPLWWLNLYRPANE
eukprot:403373562